jgi:hypothetical protein
MIIVNDKSMIVGNNDNNEDNNTNSNSNFIKCTMN